MSKLVRNLIFAIALGLITGWFLGARAAPLGEVGSLTIRGLKALAIPLLFFGIVDTFCKTKIGATDGFRLIGLSLLNACVALVISLSVARAVPLEQLINLHEIQKLLPTHPAAAVAQKSQFFDSVIPVIIAAIVLGLILRALPPDRREKISKFFAGGYQLVHRILSLAVGVIPVAVFCVLAKIVGTSGMAFLPTLGIFVALVASGMLIHVGIYYSGLLYFAGIRPREFFLDGSAALLTAFSTGSSLATLPVTLDTLTIKRGISPRFARLAAAIGTNLNHDGILLYEAMAALFIARLYGIPLSLTQQVTIAGTSVVAAVGIAGVPEAGFITLSLVLTAAGLPLEAAALLLPVDWLIGRLRATTNVASDMTVAHLLARLGR